mmetsp:Transcript_7983/g.15026  ORF Transcript_7983/g.15026 Transcript_7983/m.15026 type:complete len:230 (-) Transcript_7983:23-712(-)
MGRRKLRLHPDAQRAHPLRTVRTAPTNRKGILRAGRQGDRHPDQGRGGHQDHQEQATLPHAGQDGDRAIDAPQRAGRERSAQHRAGAVHLHVQESPVHRLRNAQSQSVRAPQEHALRGSVAQSDTQIRQADTQGVVLPGPARHRHHSLRFETREYTLATSEAERNQGHRLRIVLQILQEDVLVHSEPVLQESRGHVGTAVQRGDRYVESGMYIGGDAYRGAAFFGNGSV